MEVPHGIGSQYHIPKMSSMWFWGCPPRVRERVNAREVQYLWHCGNRKDEFVTVVTSDEKEPSVTEITIPFFTSLLV